jgi:hypothetical protein
MVEKVEGSVLRVNRYREGRGIVWKQRGCADKEELRYTGYVTDDTFGWSMSEVVVVHIFLCTSLYLPATGGDADAFAIWTVSACNVSAFEPESARCFGINLPGRWCDDPVLYDKWCTHLSQHI